MCSVHVSKNCLCAGTLCHTGPEPPLSTAHQPSRGTPSRELPYHPPDQDSTHPPQGGLRRELHGEEAVVAKERETQETGQERGVEEPPILSSQVSVACSPDQPCLTAGVRTGQTGGGGVTLDTSSFSQTPRQSTLQTCQASPSPLASCRAPEPQLHVGGYASHTLQSSTFPALRRVL